MPEAQIWRSAAVLASAQSGPNDDLTDDPMDLVVVSRSRVRSFTYIYTLHWRRLPTRSHVLVIAIRMAISGPRPDRLFLLL